MFISVEGIDGAGKSTHVGWLADFLRAQGKTVTVTREPGGTPLGEQLRTLLLTQDMAADTELLLMFAARSEHIQQVIRPALTRGEWVLTDRFTDASYAYQCGGRGLADTRVRTLEQWVQHGLQPDVTLLFDVECSTARRRLATHTDLDRFEQEKRPFFERVRDEYMRRAASEPQRIYIINSDRSLDEIRADITQIVMPEFK